MKEMTGKVMHSDLRSDQKNPIQIEEWINDLIMNDLLPSY